jgi:predicted AAA+ superfamily ATPase
MGTLPKIASLCTEQRHDAARAHLRSYLTTYIKQEIQAEALTRNVGAFQRFLTVAGQSNAQIMEFANIARESAVPASTVKEYYQILEDTLLGFFLWPHGHSERKKARPKFYFFDCGVVRAIQNRLHDDPTPQEQGFLFETWFIGELQRIRDYHDLPLTFTFWRDRSHEIDLLVNKGEQIALAVECKSGTTYDKTSIRAFKSRFPTTPLIVASMTDERPRKTEDAEIVPWREALRRIGELVD